jgi:hypothetical protein
VTRTHAAAPLVVVEDAFVARGPGVLVAPRVTLLEPQAGPFPVRLRLPDGTETTATASFDVAHMRGPGGVFAMVRLLGLSPADLPRGTEVWLEAT